LERIAYGVAAHLDRGEAAQQFFKEDPAFESGKMRT